MRDTVSHNNASFHSDVCDTFAEWQRVTCSHIVMFDFVVTLQHVTLSSYCNVTVMCHCRQVATCATPVIVMCNPVAS